MDPKQCENQEFCIQNEELSLKNEELCIKNDGLCSPAAQSFYNSQVDLYASWVCRCRLTSFSCVCLLGLLWLCFLSNKRGYKGVDLIKWDCSEEKMMHFIFKTRNLALTTRNL